MRNKNTGVLKPHLKGIKRFQRNKIMSFAELDHRFPGRNPRLRTGSKLYMYIPPEVSLG